MGDHEWWRVEEIRDGSAWRTRQLPAEGLGPAASSVMALQTPGHPLKDVPTQEQKGGVIQSVDSVKESWAGAERSPHCLQTGLVPLAEMSCRARYAAPLRNDSAAPSSWWDGEEELWFAACCCDRGWPHPTCPSLQLLLPLLLSTHVGDLALAQLVPKAA